MVRSHGRLLRGLTLGVAVAIALAACQGGTSSQSPSGSGTGGGQKGGTIYLLSDADQWDQVDPQRVYTGEDLAFFGGLIFRSLESYVYSGDAKQGTSLTPDMATDLGTHNADATQWKFTLRDGLTWQDGSELKCEDVKYAVSRTFATDVINQGPTYAIAYLKVPYKPDGQTSQYPGPYKATPAQQAMFDQAVTCDGKTITFNLNKPVPDFNYTTTLGMFPVPNPKDHPGVDVGEQYGQPGHLAWSSGPYTVQSYSTGNGGKMIFARNAKWNASSDPVRKAFPDTWEVDFGIDPQVEDQRLMASNGKDATAIQYGGVQTANLPLIFKNADTANDQYANRAISGFDPYARYLWVNVNKVPDVNIRRAMWVGLDRQAMRTAYGGDFYGDYADGVIKPNIGQDYAPTGLLDGSLDWQQGKKPADTGDPTFAQQLIGQATKKTTALSYNYPDTPTQGKAAAAIQASLNKAGFNIKLVPLERGQYYSIVFDPQKSGDFGYGGWGPDWPNASTVIPPLFTQKGGWDLSQLDDPAVNQAVDQAGTDTNRSDQVSKWQALNKQVVENMWVLPTFFGRSQTIAGNKVGPTPLYRWPAYGSWPYGIMFVKQ